MFKRILVPTDGSELTTRAVGTAIQLAQQFGASLQVLTVTEPYPYSPLAEAQPIEPQEFLDAEMRLAAQRLSAVTEAAAQAGVKCESASVEGAQPWRAICDQAAASAADLIVMASHGRSGIAGLLLGSETQKVLTHCAVPVLVVR